MNGTNKLTIGPLSQSKSRGKKFIAELNSAFGTVEENAARRESEKNVKRQGK